MPATIVVGGFWGDEGKGKIISYLAYSDKPKIIARGGVGPNAGHTVEVEGKKFGVRMLPSGFVYKDARLLIGAGVLVDPRVFLNELEVLDKDYNVRSRVGVDYRCAIIEEKHIQEDRGDEHLRKKIGTTGTGCGPANVDRVRRKAKQAKDIPELKDYLADVPLEINESLDEGHFVLIEGTQGFGLSLYYGTYPYVTSKDTTASSVAADVGIGPTRVDDVVIVFKTFPTRVGEGPFPTEIPLEEAEKMGIVEYGTVTGRRRRIGLWDGKMARYAAMVNGATQVAITGIDKLDKECYGVTEWSKLTPKAKEFIERVEDEVKVPVTLISTGPELHQIIDLRKEKL
ncbi:adenylosuccinate synthetase [Archaeoglobus profundus]|uniref:Adenylosuccinate synthetase n=1 Tax=Archaeoglobus profundus (strain DSM 5631 / JCM 9629 / NBRC 100127 / Av18) TaxID=572546 RepID=D2RGX5_ARCPA|nr:adenylosuccinate synthetase [Archaeoglobus profundus]ADB57550.1 adenylosuccinate synthetase [Archaeoglobus profundus DSM 5631]